MEILVDDGQAEGVKREMVVPPHHLVLAIWQEQGKAL